MSRDARLTLDFADDTYVFRLAWGELIQLQEASDVGPLILLRRFSDGDWRVRDIASILRLGLIGGGMEPVKALRLVRDYVEARPPMENLLRAQAVLQAGLLGAPDESVKKNEPATESELTISQAAKSGLDPSSASVPQ